MSWFNWQGRLLPYAMRYALLKSGFLDADTADDLANFDIALGSKRSTIELKNVGINAARITELGRLPPCLRLKTARIAVLRLSFVRDGYQANVELELEGIEVTVELLDDASPETSVTEPRSRSTSPASTRTPLHRKTNRRKRTSPQYDPGGFRDEDEALHIPTTQEMAQSFLLHESVRQRQEMEASMAANLRSMDDSYMSESSENGDVGTGVAGGLPDFLSGILKGVMDRAKYQVKDIQIVIQADVGTVSTGLDPTELKLQVDKIVGNSLLAPNFTIAGIALDLITRESVKPERTTISPLSPIASRASTPRLRSSYNREVSEEQARVLQHMEEVSTPESRHTAESPRSITPVVSAFQPSYPRSSSPHLDSSPSESILLDATYALLEPEPQDSTPEETSIREEQFHQRVGDSVATLDEDRFADATEDDVMQHGAESVYGIMPGDDNLSWGSRRTQRVAPPEDLWRSMLSDADSTQSLTLDEENDRKSLRNAQNDQSSHSVNLLLPNSDHVSPRYVAHEKRSWPDLETVDQPSLLDQRRSASPPGSKQATLVDTDNESPLKTSALHETHHDSLVASGESPTASPEHEAQSDVCPDPEEYPDMSESRVYSHEEAESMYLSAVMDASQPDMPGGWVSSASDKRPDALVSDMAVTNLVEEDTVAPAETDLTQTSTPRATSPLRDAQPDNSDVGNSLTRTRRLLAIDHISLSLTTTDAADGQSTQADTFDRQSGTRQPRQNANMPGAFSMYSDMSRSRANMVSSIFATSETASMPSNVKTNDSVVKYGLEIELGFVLVQADVFAGRALYALITKSAFRTAPQNTSDPISARATEADGPDEISLTVKAQIRRFVVGFSDEIANTAQNEQQSAYLDGTITSLVCEDIKFNKEDEMILQMGSVKLALGGRPLLSLRHDPANMSSSRMFQEHSSVFRLVVIQNRVSANGQQIIDIMLETASIEIHLDLSIIDDILAPYGGMSGMLELGGSFMAESGASSPVTSRPAKGVRFAGETPPEVANKAEIKINGRVDGASVTLSAPSCSLHLRTTALKFVHRHFGTSLSLNQVVLAGPYQGSVAEAPIAVDVLNLRLEYLVAPQDKDLERLLSLLTPSKDKYENDDDILIDTLLRQRRKGAVLKILVQHVNARVDSWDAIPALTSLGDELSKLSAVTKYLPEDERPGMLALLCVKNADVKLPLNASFGAMMVHIGNVHLAHVGLPALLALSVGDLTLSQMGGLEILHPLIPSSSSENLPVIMARMLGDEEVPTLKIKLFNLCIEYSIPLVQALTGKDQAQEADDALTELAQSIAGLVVGETAMPSIPRSTSELSTPAAKKIMLEVLVHDTALGYTPLTLSSKIIFVLSDARLVTMIPPDAVIDAKLELRRAAIYLRDLPPQEDGPSHVADVRGPNASDLGRFLAAESFISIASIMSADVAVHVEQDIAPQGAQAVEVDAKIELFLLETCADSTATFFATLGDLAPPSQPSTEPKYLTEPMTIEDMMASFTGEPIVEPDSVHETLFDADDDIAADADMLSSVASFDADTQELFEESEMTESLYGPISGILDVDDEYKPSQHDTPVEYPETAASLLEEDPFEIAEIPPTLMGNAALLRELDKQSLRAAHDRPVDLPEAEYEDLGLEALNAGPQVLGSKNAFALPHAGRRPVRPAVVENKSPFRLRLRDSHLIWHLHDGYDWQRTREGIIKKVEEVEQKIDERKARRRQSHHEPEEDESVIGDFLFNSIYIGVGGEHEAQDLRRAINKAIDERRSETESVAASGTSRPTTYSTSGNTRHASRRRRLKLGRSGHHKIAFELRGVAADVVVHPPGESDTISSVNLRIRDFEVFDQVPSSSWRKFLTSADNSAQRREISKPMFDIEVLTLKTLQSHAASELALRVVALPIRLHVDQDALEFINRFFEFKDPQLASDKPPSEEPFIQRLEVETVDLCLDYKPKQIDYVGLRSGHTAEFKNFVTLEGSNIRLKHVIIYGLRGFDKIHPTLNDIWVQDVMRNQLPTVIAGVAAMRSLVNIGTGIRDVVAIPVREYRKDGRVVRSIQKGAYQFGKTTASELARLGAKVALGTQTVLSSAEHFLSPTTTIPPRISTPRRVSNEHGWQDMPSEEDEPEPRAVSAYANQPLGVLAGLRSARRQLEHDLLTARDALIAVQGEVMDSPGPAGAAAAVARHAPTVLLRPVIGATRAVGTALLGVGNQIDRSNRRKNEDKYKPR